MTTTITDDGDVVIPRFKHLARAAREAGVHVNSLRCSIKAGDLPAFQMKGRRRGGLFVRSEDVAALFVPVSPKDIDAAED